MHTDELLWVMADAIAESQTMAKASHEAAVRDAGLVAYNRDLPVRSHKVLAQSASHCKRTNGLRHIDWEQETSPLELADTLIKNDRERIQRQRHLIRHLAKQRQPIDTAGAILQTMLRTLKAMEGHRETILARLKGR